MNDGAICPRCRERATDGRGCSHLRWNPARGGPLDFAKHVIRTSPFTERRRLSARLIPEEWWESEFDWLMERMDTRLDVVEGYCFAELSELDLLCMDIWHHFRPERLRGTG